MPLAVPVGKGSIIFIPGGAVALESKKGKKREREKGVMNELCHTLRKPLVKSEINTVCHLM